MSLTIFNATHRLGKPLTLHIDGKAEGSLGLVLVPGAELEVEGLSEMDRGRVRDKEILVRVSSDTVSWEKVIEQGTSMMFTTDTWSEPMGTSVPTNTQEPKKPSKSEQKAAEAEAAAQAKHEADFLAAAAAALKLAEEAAEKEAADLAAAELAAAEAAANEAADLAAAKAAADEAAAAEASKPSALPTDGDITDAPERS